MNTNGQLVRLAVARSRNVWAYYAALEVACAGNCFLDRPDIVPATPALSPGEGIGQEIVVVLVASP
jgi:hypothetical protein